MIQFDALVFEILKVDMGRVHLAKRRNLNTEWPDDDDHLDRRSIGVKQHA